MMTKLKLSDFMVTIKQMKFTILENESNYRIWKEDLETLLDMHEIKLENLKEKNSPDKSIILRAVKQTLSSDLRNQYIDYDDISVLLDDIEQQFSNTTLYSLISLKKQLYKLEMDGDSINEHIAKMRMLVMRLKSMSVVIDDKEQAHILLASLPSKYDSFISTLSMEPTINEVIKLLKAQDELKGRNEINTNDNLTFLTKINHKKKFNNVQRKCYNCGGTGHYANACPSPKDARSNICIYENETRDVDESSDSDGIAFIASYELRDDNWIIDSGASLHLTGKLDLLEDIKETGSVRIRTANNEIIQTNLVGKARVNNILIDNVYYAKSVPANLLSYNLLKENGKIVIDKNNELVFMMSDGKLHTESKNGVLMVKANKNLWHERLGHCCKEVLTKTIGINHGYEGSCNICSVSKIKRNNHKLINEGKRYQPLELISIDIAGPMKNVGIRKERFWLIAVDSASKLTAIVPLKCKSEAPVAFDKIVKTWELKTKLKIQRVRCDNAPELISQSMREILIKRDVMLENSAAYNPQQNSCERHNGIIKSMVKTWLIGKRLPPYLWPELAKSAAYIRNRVVTLTTNKAPLEFVGLKVDYDKIKSIGSMIIYRDGRTKDGRVGVLLGHEFGQTYTVFDIIDKRLIKTHDLIIHENQDYVDAKNFIKKYVKNEEVSDDELVDNKVDHSKEESNSTDQPLVKSSSTTNPKNPKPTIDDYAIAGNLRSKSKERNMLLCNEVPEHVIYLNLNAHDAWNIPEWRESMEKEINKLMEEKTWKIIKTPLNEQILSTRWVFSTKADGQKKSRIVVRGYEQSNEVESFAPTSSSVTLKILITLALKNDMTLYQIDFCAAFVQSELREDIYLHPPLGITIPEGCCLKLNKALYGLKQAGRTFYLTISKYLKSLDFYPTEFDNCLYVKYADGEKKVRTIILIYVDDCVIASRDKNEIYNIIKNLENRFSIKNLGELGVNSKLFVGVEIEKRGQDYILHQKSKIETLLDMYKSHNIYPSKTPMKEELLDIEDSEFLDEKLHAEYRTITGKLLYISSMTRVDIAYAVQSCSKFTHKPRIMHWRALIQILKYLKGTWDIEIVLSKEEIMKENRLQGFSDSSFREPKSCYGNIIYLFSVPIFWKSKQISYVTTSTYESELVGLFELVKNITWIYKLFNQLSISPVVIVYTDNLPIVKGLEKDNYSKTKAKHMRISSLWLKERIDELDIKILYVPSKNMLADDLTKPKLQGNVTLLNNDYIKNI
uniref:Retrovirus-related Pol polyprotein from transposon TNT 1-94 n=1 Tax=Strongyloides papillosus TaxID=174720 RepID=A0A0N5BJE0_STREA